MKKIVMVQDLYALLWQDMTFLNRDDVRLFVASTNDEALALHAVERVDLIVTRLVMPGMTTEEFCSRVREDPELRGVSLLLTCPDDPASIAAGSRCRANAVIPDPVYPDLLVAKAQQLLFIAPRETLRVLLSADVEGRTGGDLFYCRTRNVSITGMLIETDRALSVDTHIGCQFYLPNARKVQATGRIVRIIELIPGEEYQYGLIFTDMPDASRRVLDEYIRETSGKSSPTS